MCCAEFLQDLRCQWVGGLHDTVESGDGHGVRSSNGLRTADARDAESGRAGDLTCLTSSHAELVVVLIAVAEDLGDGGEVESDDLGEGDSDDLA